MPRYISAICIAMAAALLAAPTTAQVGKELRADDVAFFQQVALGKLDVTPIGIRRDKRCPDIRLCVEADALTVSELVDDGRYRREVLLQLGQPVAVTGGLLVLTDPGAAPKWNGAIRLSRYKLDLLYIPID